MLPNGVSTVTSPFTVYSTLPLRKSTWATPFVWEHDGRTEIVATGKKENRSYSPDGELLWHFDGRLSVLTIPSPFVADVILLAFVRARRLAGATPEREQLLVDAFQ